MRSLIRFGISGLMLLALVSVNPASAQTPASTTSNSLPVVACLIVNNYLQVGSIDRKTNGEVSALQHFLIAKGYMDASKIVSGYGTFGGNTKAALQKFQKANGIDSTGGIAGPRTRAKIKELSCENHLPTISIGSPVGGDVFKAGQIIPVTFKIQNLTTQPYVAINLLQKGTSSEMLVNQAIYSSTTIKNGINKIDFEPAKGSNYSTNSLVGTFRIQLSLGKEVVSTSTSGYFSINPVATTTATSSIKLISPNGHEVIVASTTQTIRWQSTNIASTSPVRISIYRSGVQVGLVTASTPNTGIYTWNVPKAIAQGNDYTINITKVGQDEIHDMSDGNFTIMYNI